MRIPIVNVDFDGIKVACVGDCLTYGSELLNRKVESYPARLAKLLGSGYDVLNLGFADYCASRSSAKFYLDLPALSLLKQYSPDYVILMLGTNDASLENYSGALDFTNGYKAILSALYDLPSRPQILALTSPMAFGDNTKQTEISQSTLHKLIAVQRAVLDEYHTPYIDLFNMTKDKTTLFCDDMIHFNSKGAKFLAYKVYSAIQEFESRKV